MKKFLDFHWSKAVQISCNNNSAELCNTCANSKILICRVRDYFKYILRCLQTQSDTLKL